MENKEIIHLNPEFGAFGMPPSSHVSDTMIVNSMPVLQIIPCVPNFESGLTLFKINEAAGQIEYRKILKNHGYALDTSTINLAFIADNFPTDSFTNEYGETFLQKFTDVASQGMQQLAQITNSKTGTEGAMKLLGGAQAATKDMEGNIASMLKGGTEGAMKIATELGQLKQNLAGQNSFLGGALESVDKMLGGHRVDFPQIWRNSGFTPSYTATVRLYNPNPGSPISTKQHIIGPLAAILCLSIPQSSDGKTFTWPFFLKVRSSGIYRLDPAVITNVTVVKGGDQQQIAFNQQLGMVDVRIDFTSIYSSMVVETETKFEADRPTLRNYLAVLEKTDDVVYYKRSKMRNETAKMAAVSEGPIVKITAIPPETNSASTNSLDIALLKNQAARRRLAPKVTEKEVGNRVSTVLAEIAQSLIDKSSTDFIT